MRRVAGRAALLALAGCVGWQGGTGKNAISPPGVALHDSGAPARATLLGTLWPPAGEPTFVVSGRRIVVEREGEVAAEPVTDRRGQFVANLARTGRYTATLREADAEATAAVAVADLGAAVRVDLVARRR